MNANYTANYTVNYTVNYTDIVNATQAPTPADDNTWIFICIFIPLMGLAAFIIIPFTQIIGEWLLCPGAPGVVIETEKPQDDDQNIPLEDVSVGP
jgi:uncharacterized Tic20 family protein